MKAEAQEKLSKIVVLLEEKVDIDGVIAKKNTSYPYVQLSINWRILTERGSSFDEGTLYLGKKEDITYEDDDSVFVGDELMVEVVYNLVYEKMHDRLKAIDKEIEVLMSGDE